MKLITEIPRLPKRDKDCHKGSCGRVLIVAGSVGMTGAAILASRATLVSGAGLVSLAIPKSLNTIAESQLLEIVTHPMPETKSQTLSLKSFPKIAALAEQSDVVVVGPGLSLNTETARLIRRIVSVTKKPLVLDADGLSAIGDDVSLLKNRKAPTIITPHPGEMSRLTDLSTEKINAARKQTAMQFANEWNVIIVLKGNKTVVTDGEKVYINDTGNPGMATAGSGDVLTGTVAGLIAQGVVAVNGAVLGVYLHGLAGDLAAKETGIHSLIAGDILRYLPKAYLKRNTVKK